MVVVLVVASGAAWESPLLALVGERHDLVLLKRCVDVDDLLASASAGQADAAVVGARCPRARPRGGRPPPSTPGPRSWPSPGRAVRMRSRPGPPGSGSTAWSVPTTFLGSSSCSSVTTSRSPTRSSSRRPSAAAAVTAGRVLVVWGPAGAPGRTTLACGVAAALAARGLRTTLVDADPYGGCGRAAPRRARRGLGPAGVARSSADGGLARGFASAQRALDDDLTVVTGLPRPDRWLEVRSGVARAPPRGRPPYRSRRRRHRLQPRGRPGRRPDVPPRSQPADPGRPRRRRRDRGGGVGRPGRPVPAGARAGRPPGTRPRCARPRRGQPDAVEPRLDRARHRRHGRGLRPAGGRPFPARRPGRSRPGAGLRVERRRAARLPARRRGHRGRLCSGPVPGADQVDRGGVAGGWAPDRPAPVAADRLRRRRAGTARRW